MVWHKPNLPQKWVQKGGSDFRLSHFKGLWYRIWSENPRSHRKLMSRVQPVQKRKSSWGKVSSQEERLSFKQKLGLFYIRDIKWHRISLLRAVNRCFNFHFSTDDEVFCSFREISVFLRLFSTFLNDKVSFQFFVFALIDSISGSLSGYTNSISKRPAALFKDGIGSQAQFPSSQLPSWLFLSVFSSRHFLLFSFFFPSNQAVLQAAHIIGASKQKSHCHSDNKPYNFPELVLFARCFLGITLIQTAVLNIYFNLVSILCHMVVLQHCNIFGENNNKKLQHVKWRLL